MPVYVTRFYDRICHARVWHARVCYDLLREIIAAYVMPVYVMPEYVIYGRAYNFTMLKMDIKKTWLLLKKTPASPYRSRIHSIHAFLKLLIDTPASI